MTKRHLAFTLIELLVVIAIIGILSGLIVVTMNGVTQKATIAKSQVFSNSLRSSLMMNLVSDWNFDGSGVSDGSSATSSYLLDMWGQQNGTVTAAPPAVLSGNNCISGSCLSFNGTTQYVSIPYSSAFNFGTQMTAMVWAKGEAQSFRAIIGQWDFNGQRAWSLMSHSASPYNQLVLNISDDGTGNANHYKYWATNSAFFDGNWHLFGFTWNAGTVNLYVDGQVASSTGAGTLTTNSINPSNALLTIGALVNVSSPLDFFSGQIDEARIYSAAIPTSEIKEQYYAGLNHLLVGGNITKQEYLNRITTSAVKND